MEKTKCMLVVVYCLFAVLCIAQQPMKTGEPKKVLFVCEHGAAKSVIASAYFNKLALEKGLHYTSGFRGIAMDTALSPAAAKGLQKDGFSTQQWRPARVTQEDINGTSVLITFDCTLPKEMIVAPVVYQWQALPAVSENYDSAREEIKKRVEELLIGLQKK
jgi:arsenate reductase